jgi:translation elongation factor EF-Tu-like GTPase
MTVADVFFIRNRGLVATGQVEAGSLRVGDHVLVNGQRQVRVEAIEMFRKTLDTANAGDNVGLLLADVTNEDVASGDVLTTDGGWESSQPPAGGDGEAERVFRDAGLGS